METNKPATKSTLYFDKNLDVRINPYHLTFSDRHLEEQFIFKFNKNNLLTTRFGIFLSFLLVSLYAFVDSHIFPSSYTTIWMIRFVVDILILILFFYTFRNNYLLNLQRVNFFASLIISFGILLLFTFPVENSYIYIFISTYTLLIIAVFIAIGLRFIYALTSTLVIDVLLFFLLYLKFDLLSSFLYIFFFISSTFLLGIGAYFSELKARQLFLKKLYSSKLLQSLKDAQDELQEQVNRDPMTNLYNRRYFNSFAQDLINISKRNKTIIAVVMIDIDHFKKVNDQYGHSIGDDVIKFLSKQLLLFTRSSDLVFRLGGEEFALLLPNTDKDGALLIAQKLKDHIQEQSLPVDDMQQVKFTVSMGISSVNQEETEIETALKKADKALYKAKEDGRNKIVQCIY